MLIDAPLPDAPEFVIVPMDSDAAGTKIAPETSASVAWSVVTYLRRRNIAADVSLSGKRDRRIERARRRGARAILFVHYDHVFGHLYVMPMDLGSPDYKVGRQVEESFAGFTVSDGKSPGEIVVSGWR